MNELLLAFAIYAVSGMIVSLSLARWEEKEGRSFTLLFWGGGSFGFIWILFFWPLILMFSLLDRGGLDEAKNTKNQGEKDDCFPVGTRGVTKTKMMSSGRIEIGKHMVDALSVSGALDIGIEVEVVGQEFNQLKVRKHEPVLGEQSRETRCVPHFRS